ncbi:hypothetical protein EON63_13840 [archaeon]|nr:MAG: hypothetical protein EON63_13840 [archaeon]
MPLKLKNIPYSVFLVLPFCLGLRFSSRSPQQVDNPEVAKSYSPTLLDSKQRLRLQIQERIAQFKKHKSDCGSAAVQVLVTTEKIINLARHFIIHK